VSEVTRTRESAVFRTSEAQIISNGESRFMQYATQKNVKASRFRSAEELRGFCP